MTLIISQLDCIDVNVKSVVKLHDHEKSHPCDFLFFVKSIPWPVSTGSCPTATSHLPAYRSVPAPFFSVQSCYIWGMLRNAASSLLIACLILSLSACRSNTLSGSEQGRKENPKALFELVYVHPRPVITKGDPGTEGNRYGFEGGRAHKLGDTYHLFTTEPYADPHWSAAIYLDLEQKTVKWWREYMGMRTPLGMIPEGDGEYTIFFTALDDDHFGHLGMCRVRFI
jgi:hypothetical protein